MVFERTRIVTSASLIMLLAGMGTFGSFTPAIANTENDVQINPSEGEGLIDEGVGNHTEGESGFTDEEELIDQETALTDELNEDVDSSELGSAPLQPESAQLRMLQPMSVQPGQGVAGLWNDVENKRLSGPDRYATAVAVSKDTYPQPSNVHTVVIASGLDFPDSLSAAPLAAKLKGPLLLTDPLNLTQTTKAEVERLKPSQVIVVGSRGAVSKKVEDALNALLPGNTKITRYSGPDRYDTSLAIAEGGWRQGASDLFIATGLNFPDALAAGAAAGAIDAPVLLVRGTDSKLPTKVIKFIADKKVSKVHIAGSSAVVSSQLENELKKLPSVKQVKRYQGADRFITAAKIADAIFAGPTNTYLANGFQYPDALTGAAAAGAQGAPLILSRHECIPSISYDANDRLIPAETTLLGGTPALSTAVNHGNECMTRPKGASNASFNGMQQLYALINKARFDAGRTGFRVADTKVGTSAYSWASGQKFVRNTAIKTQQPWVRNEAVARAPLAASAQVNYVYKMFITDVKNGTRKALLGTYGGVRPFISVGYYSGSTGYATLHIGTTPK